MKALWVQMIYLYLVFQFVEGRCHGNQLILGKCHERRLIPLAFFALLFKNELQYHCLNVFSPLGKLAEGLSIILALISSFFTMSKAISVSTRPIFTIFLPNGRYLREFSWSSPFLPIPQGRWHGNQFCVVSKTQNTCNFCNFYTIWKRFGCRWQIWNFFSISQGTLPWQPILFGTGLVRSEQKYLRIRWTDFHNLFTIW